MVISGSGPTEFQSERNVNESVQKVTGQCQVLLLNPALLHGWVGVGRCGKGMPLDAENA